MDSPGCIRGVPGACLGGLWAKRGLWHSLTLQGHEDIFLGGLSVPVGPVDHQGRPDPPCVHVVGLIMPKSGRSGRHIPQSINGITGCRIFRTGRC